MKARLAAALCAAACALSTGAQAATTAPSNFNIQVTLTSSCSVTSAPTDVVFTYTSFQGAVSNSSGGAYTVRCTNNLPFTMALDATSGTVLGLNYTLSIPTTSQTGTGANQAYTVTGSMAASQSGTCAAASCSASQVRTITITY